MNQNPVYLDPAHVEIMGDSLELVLERHAIFLATSGAEGKQAVLDGANLCAVRMQGRNLSKASMVRTNLSMAVLIGAEMSDSNLRSANLENAYLEHAQLQRSSLVNARLCKANLNSANLTSADLRFCDLRFATLYRSKLFGSRCTGVKLFGSLRTDWDVSETECNYVFMDRGGTERLPSKKKSFGPGDFGTFFDRWPSIERAFEEGLGPLDPLLLQYASGKIRAGPFPPEKEYDFFISHASEDKEEIVLPLVKELLRLGCRVWYDKFVLRVGDSLRRTIDLGLTSSKFGVVVLSQSFFSKEWPQYELDGLFAREMVGEKVVLPIWHRLTKDDVLRYSPKLADKVALNSSLLSVQEMAVRLFELVS